MTFLWIDNQGLPRRQFGQQRFERRIDDRTAADIADAMRARGIRAAAQAMDYLRVDVDVARRILAGANKRGGKADPRQARPEEQARTASRPARSAQTPALAPAWVATSANG